MTFNADAQRHVQNLILGFREFILDLEAEKAELRERLNNIAKKKKNQKQIVNTTNCEPSADCNNNNLVDHNLASNNTNSTCTLKHQSILQAPTTSASSGSGESSNGDRNNIRSSYSSTVHFESATTLNTSSDRTFPKSTSVSSKSDTHTANSESTKPPSYRQVVPKAPARTKRKSNTLLPTNFKNNNNINNNINNTISSATLRLMESRPANMSPILGRGALIVLEGLDRVGKSTLAQNLVNHLERTHKSVVGLRFPDRSTAIGDLINQHLVDGSKPLDDRSMHLLFSANRWEHNKRIRNLLEKGTNIIVDRYSYSGIAYSCAQRNLKMSWCCHVETGLPRPDLVIFLELAKEAQYQRPGFGCERFETRDYQEAVREEYEKLIKISKEEWLRIDVENKGPDQVLAEIIIPVRRCIESCGKKPVGTLSFAST